MKRFIEENIKYLFGNFILILIAILYYILRVESSLLFILGKFIWFYTGLIIFIVLVASIFYTKKNYFHRSIIAISTLIVLSLFMFAKVGDYISIGTISVLNNSAIKIFKAHSENIPDHDLRMTGDWIVESEDWELNDKEKRKLNKYFKNNKNHLAYGDNYCFFILGGFLDNASGYAYKISDSEELPKSFGMRISYTEKISENWIYFATN